MELSEIKKSQVDEIHFDEKVLLATQTINWFAVRQEKLHRQLKVAASKTDELKDVAAAHDKMHAQVLKGLNKILEDWGNFIDGNDALDEIDTVVTTPAYDILNNRFAPES